jgi:thiol-disulfide isomerase/thioredoxin
MTLFHSKLVPSICITFSFIATISVSSFLLAAETSKSEAADPPPSVADEFLQAFRDPASGKLYGISNRLEQELGQAGGSADETAQKLLDIRSEFVANLAVFELLEELVRTDRKPLAAKILVHIARAKMAAQKIEPPNVVVGQLIVEDGQTDPALVMAQMPIFEDGYFVGEIGRLDRPISFRSHGYKDLDVQLNDKDGDVVYVGQVKMKPFDKADHASLKGRVILDGNSSAKSAVVTLSVAMGPINTPHNGYSGRMHWPEGLKVPVSETGEFQIDGLNPSEYNVIVTADGHVDLYKKLTLVAGEQLETEPLRLFNSDLGFYIGKSAPPTEELAWEPDYKTALKRAETEKKPLLVMMTATWCGPCQLLEKQTLHDEWIRHFLSSFVVVKAYEDREVEQKYGLRGYPTLVFIDSSGKPVHTCVGYMPAFSFAGHCAQALQATSLDLPPEIERLIEKKIIKLPSRGEKQ